MEMGERISILAKSYSAAGDIDKAVKWQTKALAISQ